MNARWTDRNGENREETTWFRVAVYNRQAENCAQYLSKGRRVLVTGRVSADAFIGNDGQARASLNLNAREVVFLSTRGEDTGTAGMDPYHARQGQGQAPSRYDAPAPQSNAYGQRNDPPPPPDPGAGQGYDEEDDDIPF